MTFYVNKVAVLGAGVMGAQIAAHFANAAIPVVLFDLKSQGADANAIINKAISNLLVLNPKPIASEQRLTYITAANYDDDSALLKDCNLVIEAIAERLDFKEALYQKITPYLNKDAIIASNTSGLSIEKLVLALPVELRPKFCGIHFFNPPRYMSLIELIPHQQTAKPIIEFLESFLVPTLGKTVIVAKDTPNFIANRLGVFSLLVTCWHTKNFALGLEVVDKITGKLLGRAKSATFRTADVVGLDVFAHVAKTLADNCQDDGFAKFYALPEWIDALIKKGALGAKTKCGLFRKDSDGIKVFDLATMTYILADKNADKEILDILHNNKDWATRFDHLHASANKEAQFLWACFRDLFHYAAVLLGVIADNVRDMDVAIRAGFAWKEGIFEIWQNAGWLKIANWIEDDIKHGKTIAKVELPQWVFQCKDGVYAANKHFNFAQGKFVAQTLLPVYSRQLFPELLLNETINTPMHVLYENAGVKLWHSGDNIGILSFKSKMCVIGMDVLAGIDEAINVAETSCTAMVIWQQSDIFSAGANLEEFGFAIMMNGEAAIEDIINAGHRIISNKIRYSKIPIVAAVKGYAFGGGCEVMLHCDAVVAALESYIGLVEAGVGILPGWGGTKEMAYRAALASDPWQELQKRYKNLALAKVATSALEAKEMGFLRDSDIIVMNKQELLLVAKERAKLLALAGYRPPLMAKFAVFGEQGIATISGLLVNMFEGGQISEHDYWIARNIAIVMCGGMITEHSKVSEEWLLTLEKREFKNLAMSEKTNARIQHMLTHGKPLRN